MCVSVYVFVPLLVVCMVVCVPVCMVVCVCISVCVCVSQGYRQKDYFIATQGPLPHTVQDFWRMAWEWKCHSIVMLTELQEREQVSHTHSHRLREREPGLRERARSQRERVITKNRIKIEFFKCRNLSFIKGVCVCACVCVCVRVCLPACVCVCVCVRRTSV